MENYETMENVERQQAPKKPKQKTGGARKGIDSRKVKVFAGTALLATSLFAGVGIYDTTINHVDELCPLTKVFGLSHQAFIINADLNSQGYFAYYQPAETSSRRVVDEVAAKVVVDENGTISYVLPDGYEDYTLVGNKAVKYSENIAVEEQVIVTKSECIVRADGTCDLVTTEVNRFLNGEELDETLETTEPTTPTR